MRTITVLAIVGLLLVLGVTAAHAQSVTTGSISGTVIESGGDSLPGATVTAVHQPTGTTYSAVSNQEGRFTIPNVRVGGPYLVVAELSGFSAPNQTDLNVALGRDAQLRIEMQRQEFQEEVTVVGDTAFINPNRTGATSSVSTAEIEALPTVRRSLQDFARTDPLFAVDPSDPSATRITVAGRNNRYNTIQIDGAVNNDLFGLADTGTPGGQTDTQPISLDAIEQLQMVVSPYDVRQGGFTGGGINAVTRSGSNQFKGSIYGSTRDQDNVGDGPFDIPIAEFSEDQYGFRVGGPLSQDKLFFFVNGEINERTAPTGVSADGSTGETYQGDTDAAEFRQILIDQYGYDPGALGDISGDTDSDLAFLRLDWNASASHMLTLRHNYVDASRDIISNRADDEFRFPTAIYTIADETNSTVAQLNSVFSSNMFNEARLGYQTIKDVRTVPVIFPTVEVGGFGPRSGAVIAGTERFSGANSLDQDVLELTDDLTVTLGDHTLTLGTHNELFGFDNLFLSEFYGYYYFPDLDALQQGLAEEYRIGFANGDDPRRPTSFDVRQYGVYAGDQWRVNDGFTFTYGLRVDLPSYPDDPSSNPLVQDAIGFDTSSTGSDDPVVSPRLGFNWDPTGRGTDQLRGGIGVFAGRTPYVWISNAYANTGVESSQLAAFCPDDVSCIEFVPDALDQPRDLGGAATPTVDLIDPDFEFPRVLRTTLAYDKRLPGDIEGSLETTWTQTQEDVFYLNVNRVQTGTSPLDGRPTYSDASTALNDALLLTNTGEGEILTAALRLHRSFENGLTVSGTYAWMDAESAMDATSSRAVSNWQFRPTPGDIFEDDVATSAFEVEQRANLQLIYDFDTGPLGHTLGLFYSAESGRPYSLLMGGDPNEDGFTSNDLLFVPGSPDDIILLDAAGNPIPYDRFADFLRSAGIDATAGRILDRNESNAPWVHQLDFHYGIELPISRLRTQLTFDILNLANLIDSEEGVVEFVNFQTYTPVSLENPDPATGKPVYQENFTGALDPGQQFSTSDIRSRWSAKIGLRFSL